MAVNAAIQFYHDQESYQAVEDVLHGVMQFPKSCPVIHRPPEGPSQAVLQQQEKDEQALQNELIENGLGQDFQAYVEARSLWEGPTGKRTRDDTLPYPPHQLQHIRQLEEYQSRPVQAPNVITNDVSYGCGRPGNEACLKGQNGLWILTHRLSDWQNGELTHNVTINWGAQRREMVLGQRMFTMPISEDLWEVLKKIMPGDGVSIASGVGNTSETLQSVNAS